MEEQTHTSPARAPKVEKVASIALMAVAFLTPIFFIPSGLFSLPFSKSLVAYVGIILCLVLFIFSILETGKIKLPTNPVSYVAFLIPVVFLVSSLASPSIESSLIGYGFETGTFAFMMLMFAFLFLVSWLYTTREKVFYSYLLFLGSFGIVALYQIARLMFGPDALTFGVFTSGVSNLIGSWNDLGVFFAASAFLALITLEMLPLTKVFRALMYVSLVVSLVFLTIVNFSTLWYVLAAFSLVAFVYVLLNSRGHGEGEHGRRRISYSSLAILLISVLFIFAGGPIGNSFADKLGVSNLEVRPSWTATLEVVQHALGENAVIGSGPNTFQNEWLKWKPAGINSTLFWNTDFSYGIGLIPTFAVTTGVLGLLVWLAFFAAYAYAGIRAIFSGNREPLPRYLILSSFFVSLMLWVIAVVYVPNISIITLTFFFTGLFIASAYNEGLLSFRTISLYQNSKLGFVTVLSLVFALVLSLGAGYYVTRNFLSSMYFQKSLQSAAVAGDLDAAQRNMMQAVALRENDIYYRSLSEIYILRLNQILAREASDEAAVQALRTEFQATLGEAVKAGLKAVEVEPTNYQNHVALGRIYESVVPPPFKIEGAYEKAKESYEKGLALNPKSPEILLLRSRLEVANNNIPGAREFAVRALQEKPNYVDGYFLLSQIEVSAGNLKQAIQSVESATFLAPNNPGIYFQLGLLKYNDSDWAGAAGAFEKAVQIVSDYANAKYFLGLSYSKLGRPQNAIQQFESLKATNPENKEIDVILQNLRAGLDPFANIQPPLDNTPEKRENPPVDQE